MPKIKHMLSLKYIDNENLTQIIIDFLNSNDNFNEHSQCKI